MPLQFDASEDDLKVFLQEADEQIELLQNETIRLEKEYQDEALVGAIFRAAHTLKGSSAMIGHTRMAELTHAMESVFDRVRKGSLIPSSEIIDTILSALDGLNVLREEVVTKEASAIDLSGVVAVLHGIVEEGVGAPAPGQPTEAATIATGGETAQARAVDGADAALVAPQGTILTRFPLDEGDKEQLRKKIADEGFNAWLIDVDLQPDSPWLAVRAFQILTDLSGLGEVYRSRPSKTEIEAEKVPPKIQLVFLSKEDAGKISEAVSTIDDVVTSSSDQYTLADLSASVPASRTELVPSVPVSDEGKRLVDLGPDGRGKPAPQLPDLAAQKVEKMAQNVRVDVERLDKLMNLVGELVIDRTRLQQIGLQLEAELGSHDSVDSLGEAAQHIGRITDELQEEVMRIRMLPIENVFNKFPRLVRGLSQKLEKKIDLVIEGKETELDRSVIEKIDDPIIHLLRNSVDHGIESPEERRAFGKPESGLIKLSAWHEENHIVISVQDDGRGMDPEKLKASAVRKGIISQDVADRMDDRAAIDLIFAPGFSTAAQTTEVSGRGVGMDIVRANIEKLSGFVAIETAVGRGTRFLVKLPLTLAIIRALLVGLGGQKFAIPMSTVVETLRFDPQEIKTVKMRQAIQLRGKILPLVSLRELFNMPPLIEAALEFPEEDGKGGWVVPDLQLGSATRNGNEKRMFVVAVRVGDRQMGLEVDSLIGETEIVIKPLSRFLGEVRGVSGVTILGDGQVAIICDVPSLINRVIQEQLLV